MPTKAPQVDWTKAQPVQSADVDWSQAQPIQQGPVSTDPSGRTPTGEPAEGDTRNGFQRWADSLTTRDPRREEWQGPVRNAVDAFSQGVAQNVLQPFAHPEETLKGVGKVFVSGNPTEEMGEAMVKPIVQDFAENGPKYAFPHQAGNLAGIWATGDAGSAAAEGALKGARAATSRVFDPMRPYRSPLIPPNEAAARAATDVIRPNPLEYRNVVSSLTTRMPEIKKFLADQGVTPKSPLEFAKGATGAGKQASSFFQENLIAPNAEARAGSGTIGSVYGRLGEINDELRPVYRSRTMGEQMTKEAADHVAELERERDNLNNLLYGELSKRTGLPEDEIRDINQRGAQLQHVGDVADAAQAMRRSGFSGYTPTGMPIPMGTMDRVLKLVSHLRGGPEAMAGRKLVRVLSEVTDEPKSLPNPEDLNAHRLNYALQEEDSAAANRARAAARKPQGMGPTQPPAASAEADPEAVTRLMDKLRSRASSNLERARINDRLTEQNRASAAQEVAHASDLRNAAQDAAAERAKQASEIRQSLSDKNRGEAAREVLHANDLDRAAQDAAADRAKRVAGFRQSRDAMTEAARKLNGETRRTAARSKFNWGGSQQ